MNDLTAKKCLPCEIGAPPLDKEKLAELLSQVPAWQTTQDGERIFREFEFTDFKAALAFLDSVGDIAEAEGHHPDLHLERYKHVRIEIYTHATNGLSENDFILAAKIDALG